VVVVVLLGREKRSLRFSGGVGLDRLVRRFNARLEESLVSSLSSSTEMAVVLLVQIPIVVDSLDALLLQGLIVHLTDP